MRARLGVPALATVLALALSACGGDSEPSADPAPTPSETASGPSESESPSSTASPTPTTPKQPRGEYGVTYRIQNWKRYAQNPVVLGWKKAWEASGGAFNRGEVLAEVRRTHGGGALRDTVSSIQEAAANNWRVKKVARVRMRDVRRQGATATVDACVWAPSVSVFKANGEPLDPLRREWINLTSQMRRQDGTLKLTSFAYRDPCKSGRQGGSQ